MLQGLESGCHYPQIFSLSLPGLDAAQDPATYEYSYIRWSTFVLALFILLFYLGCFRNPASTLVPGPLPGTEIPRVALLPVISLRVTGYEYSLLMLIFRLPAGRQAGRQTGKQGTTSGRAPARALPQGFLRCLACRLRGRPSLAPALAASKANKSSHG